MTEYHTGFIHSCAPVVISPPSNQPIFAHYIGGPDEKIARLEAAAIEDEQQLEELENRVKTLEIEQQNQLELFVAKNQKSKSSTLFWSVLLAEQPTQHRQK